MEIGSGSVNKLQVSTQRLGTYRIKDQRMLRRTIAYDHSLNTRGLRWNDVQLDNSSSKNIFAKPCSILQHDTFDQAET